jgi:hypothetical protein
VVLPGQKSQVVVNYERSVTNNYTYSTGAVLSSNISEFVDFNISYNTVSIGLSVPFSHSRTITTEHKLPGCR